MKDQLDYKEILSWYQQSKKDSIKGLYLPLSSIKPFLNSMLITNLKLKEEGSSLLNNPIYSIKFGSGARKILIWSQMHGNESTGTKALIDLSSFIDSNEFTFVNNVIFKNTTILMVPILNPDGAAAYTRENAEGIDLNRDAVALKAKESQVLQRVLKEFNPDFCFNLHDQRTIFNVEGTKNPATLSFLAPSVDKEQTLTDSRKITMSVIVEMNQLLQKIIPHHIARYTDEFYPNATGDNFQKAGHHTILIEAGHYYNDYEREEVRKFNFLALLQGIYFIATTHNFDNYLPYFDIPNNEKRFYDVVFRNTLYNNKVQDVAFQYKFSLDNNKIVKSLMLENKGDLSNYYGHFEQNFNGNSFS